MKYTPYSYSKLSVFLKCPQQFKFHYIDHIPGGGATPASDEGRSFHKFAEIYDSTRASLATPVFDLVLEEALDYISPPMTSESVINVTEMAKNYITKPLDTAHLVGVEYKFGVNHRWEECGYHDDDAFFRGVWDQVFIEGGLADINDHKTSRQIKADPFQRDCYTAAVIGVFPQVTDVRFAFLYSRLDWVDRQNISINAIKDSQAYINHLILCIEGEKDFKPTPSQDSCKWCPYHSICPVRQGDGIDFNKAPTTKEEVEDLVLAMEGASDVQSQIRKLLQAYVDEYGPTEVMGKLLSMSQSMSWRGIDAVTLLLTLQENGVADWHKCFSAKWPEVRSALDEHPDLEAHLDRIGKRSIRQTFSMKDIAQSDKK